MNAKISKNIAQPQLMQPSYCYSWFWVEETETVDKPTANGILSFKVVMRLILRGFWVEWRFPLKYQQSVIS